MASLDNYLMKPQSVGDIVLYPITILEYEEFKLLFNSYMLLDIPQLQNKMMQDNKPKIEFDNLYDYMINIIKNNKGLSALINLSKFVSTLSNNDLKELEKEEEVDLKQLLEVTDSVKDLKIEDDETNICRLFSMVVKNKVVFNKSLNAFAIKENNKIVGVINKDNFYEIRDKIMEMNLIFTPLIAPTLEAQKYIDAAIGSNDEIETDFETIVVMVSVSTNKDISNYSYYKLMSEFHAIMRLKNRDDTTMYNANGCTDKDGNPLDTPNLLEPLGHKVNPYEGLFKVNENSEEEEIEET